MAKRFSFTFAVCLLVVLTASPNAVHAQEITNLGGTMTSPFQDRNAIQLPAPNVVDSTRRSVQLSGFEIFHRFVTTAQGLGPQFNHFSCGGCHVNNGRGRVKLGGRSETSSMLVKVSHPGLEASGAPRDIAGVGEQLQDHREFGRPLYNIVLTWKPVNGRYPDGTRYTLLKPKVNFKIPGVSKRNVVSSIRMTPPVIGPGLLEAIPEETILLLSDPADSNGDGISGKPQYVIDRDTGGFSLGRFGFKASHATVEQQSGAAAFNDIGVSSRLFPNADSSIEMDDDLMNRITVYLQLAGVPAARNQSSPKVIRGKELFQQVGCSSCHQMTLTTGTGIFPEVSNQEIHPFTDLLLHDMGPGLADKRGEFSASGAEWRTTPLWGLGFSEKLSTVKARYLHDGRARTVEEAILWHAGEAKTARSKFKRLKKKDRSALIAFLRSL